MEPFSLKEGGPAGTSLLALRADLPSCPAYVPPASSRGFSGAYIMCGETTARSSQADEGAGPPCWGILEGKAGAVTPQLCNLKQVIQTF